MEINPQTVENRLHAEQTLKEQQVAWAEELDLIDAELARRDLHHFVKKVWEFVEPDVEFVDNWHIRELCRVLEFVSRGEIQRIIINVPPGTMKSLLVSVMWPAWEWATRPQLRYLTASYGAHLTTRDNLRIKGIIASPWYQRHFGLALVDDQNQKTRFNTVPGGWRIATSIAGVGTGEHPDRIIIDDALNAEQARSEIERDRVNRWYDRTVSSRGVSRGVCIVIVAQRLHEEDICGYLLGKDESTWEHVCFPMRYEPTTPVSNDPSITPHIADPRDPRKEPNELLWPMLFTEKKVKLLEIDLGEYGVAGQLQQRPAPEGGGDFKREWFKFVDASPRFARRVRAWDTGATENAGDYTAGVRICEDNDLFYIEDVQREQYGPAGVDGLIKSTAEKDGDLCAIREEREGGSAGKAVTAARAKMLKGFSYAEVVVSANKRLRVRPFRAQCEAGNVYLVRGPWNEAFIQELCMFPTGKHDDQVDSAGCAFNAVLLEPRPVLAAPTGVGSGKSAWGDVTQ